MAFFRERNKLNVEYSGYQDVTQLLRKKLDAVLKRYIADQFSYNQGYNVYQDDLKHELMLHMGDDHIYDILQIGKYDFVFSTVEIFLKLAKDQAYSVYKTILDDIKKAFNLSGSVYYIDDNGEVILRIDTKLAENLKETEKILSNQERVSAILFNSVGKLLSRKDTPKNIVRDIFVAFEDYLKNITGEKAYDKAIEALLHKQNILVNAQKQILDKLHSYRSDTFAVAHAGNTKEPDEIDAIWFLDTITAQIRLIDQRTKQKV